MKGITYLAIGTVLLAGCAKGNDPASPDKPLKADMPNAGGTIIPNPPPAQSQGSGPYKFTFAPYGTNVYKTVTKVISGQSKPKESTFTMTNIAFKNADGTYTMQSDTSSVNGMPPVKKIQTVDPSGKVLKTQVDTGGGMHAVANDVTITAAFPDHPVKIGESWTKTQQVQKGTIVSIYKLVKVNGDLATIEESRESLKPKVASKGMIEMEMSSGIPHTMTLDVDSEAPGPKKGVPIKIHMDTTKQ